MQKPFKTRASEEKYHQKNMARAARRKKNQACSFQKFKTPNVQEFSKPWKLDFHAVWVLYGRSWPISISHQAAQMRLLHVTAGRAVLPASRDRATGPSLYTALPSTVRTNADPTT